MIFLSSTPHRISLFGGSTDHPKFIKKFKKAKVICFSCNLKTHVALHRDFYGLNSSKKLYNLNYSKKEKVTSINDIKNDLIRVVFQYFEMPPVTLSFFSDLYSYGSGLASSSSYILSLIDVCLKYHGNSLSLIEKAKLALKLERKINKYTGFQDPFGCAINGLNLISTKDDFKYSISNLNTDIFKKYDFYLYPTGVSRKSNLILDSLSNHINNVIPIYEIAEKAFDLYMNKKYESFVKLINESWHHKKKSDKNIISKKGLIETDTILSKSKSIISHKLLGAGNGGFFLCLTKKDIKLKSDKLPNKFISIALND